MFLLTLPAGDISDRIDQRKVFALSLVLEGICGALLVLLTLGHFHRVLLFYLVMMLFGAARGFSGPASQSLLPFLVPQERLPKSIAWSSSAFQTAVIAGPAIGGFLYALGPVAAYAACTICFVDAS